MQKLILLTLVIFSILSINLSTTAYSADKQYKILATTFPMYLLTRNIIQGEKGLTLELLIPAELGCPHDYALSPKDMRKLAGADILVINGLGLEEFLGAPLERANKDIKVINSSEGITNTLDYPDSDIDLGEHSHAEHSDSEPDAHSHSEHSNINPHIFATPGMSMELSNNIAKKLSELIPEGASLFRANAEKYAAKMLTLSEELSNLKNTLKNSRIIQPHGIFDYLAREANLEIVATLQPHGNDPSASRIIQLIDIIKSKDVGAIIVEPQYSSKVANILSRETRIPIIKLDPVASGDTKNSDDLFFTKMKQNIATIKSTLESDK